MPGVITVPEFVREARDDYTSPTTSTFVHWIPHCRETVSRLEEVRRKSAKYALLLSGECDDGRDICVPSVQPVVCVCVWVVPAGRSQVESP